MLPDFKEFFYIEHCFAVTPKRENLLIVGISESFVEIGTSLNLLCTMNRTKPGAADMFWMINGRREDGSVVTQANEDGTFNQQNSIEYRFHPCKYSSLIKSLQKNTREFLSRRFGLFLEY